uniref:major histocompatibility complex class I-related gene protein-like isoform X2 n=1 Tax=Scatophagus argus TaxID=75038 RepID=UPI001ED853B8|nr:major histocompatibility complex class I-related gene protein-like isoform X2 [Scatophagus argus]
MKGFILLLLLSQDALAVKHYLKYFLSGSSGLQNFPEFMAFSTVDDIQGGYCDSKGRRPEPRHDWTRKLTEDYPEHFEYYAQECIRYQPIYRAHIVMLKQQLNKTGGVHIFQRIHGCEWDEETGEVNAFNQFGYNGEDFIALDSKTMTWVAAKPQAVITKHKWNRDIIYIEAKRLYNAQICPERLKKYVEYLKSFLQKVVLPSVSLLQKSPSSPVSCHATGFYPDRAMMFWTKDGEEHHEGVDHGEILANHDGTFQMTVELNISGVTLEDWRRYDCVFHLSGVEDNIVTRLDKVVIRTNWDPKKHFCFGSSRSLWVCCWSCHWSCCRTAPPGTLHRRNLHLEKKQQWVHICKLFRSFIL